MYNFFKTVFLILANISMWFQRGNALWSVTASQWPSCLCVPLSGRTACLSRETERRFTSAFSGYLKGLLTLFSQSSLICPHVRAVLSIRVIFTISVSHDLFRLSCCSLLLPLTHPFSSKHFLSSIRCRQWASPETLWELMHTTAD